jgi:L-malate glycosyltransferase
MNRVGIVAPYPPPLGGMAHQANILARYLEEEGATVHRVRTNNHRNIPPFRDISAIRQFGRIRDKIDVLNVHTCCYMSYFGTVAPIIRQAKKAGLRVVVTYKGGSAREVFNHTGEFGLRWLRMADLVTVPSRFLRDIFNDFGIETRVVHNLYEADLPTENPRTPRVPNPRLIMTRGLGHYYNVETTIRAFEIVLQHYPQATLLLAGSGNREKQIRSLVSNIGLPNVEFLGNLGRAEIHSLYRSGDIFVSSSGVDNFPGALLEAFLFGVPIVTTDAGGIPYMVEHGETARVVSVDDHQSFAREILYLLENPAEAQRMAVAAQGCIEQYRWNAVRDDWFDVLGIES